MTQKHTTLPWKDYGHAGQINGADNSFIFQVESKNTKEDVEFVLRACNSHYNLLEALKKANEEIFANDTLVGSERYFKVRKILCAAINKAEGC